MQTCFQLLSICTMPGEEKYLDLLFKIIQKQFEDFVKWEPLFKIIQKTVWEFCEMRTYFLEFCEIRTYFLEFCEMRTYFLEIKY